MSYSDVAVVYSCLGDELIGIASVPGVPAETGILVIVGGPQYRAGSHRQFVLLARELAEQGFPAFRFDYRGMGDSSGEPRNFEGATDDIAAAVDAFIQTCPTVRRVVLWGLCDGASAALLYWHARHDERIAGMCLLNPWVRSTESLARTQIKHYYGQRFLQREFWKKLGRGEVALAGAVRGFMRNVRHSVSRSDTSSAPNLFQTSMLKALAAFPGKIVLVLSGRDYTAKEFLERVGAEAGWADAVGRSSVRRHDVVDADHTFSSAAWRREVEQVTLRLLHEVSRAR